MSETHSGDAVGLETDDRVSALLDLRKTDVLVAFDMRRYQRDTIEFGRRAEQLGAKIILVTDPWLSPLAADAKIVLPVAVQTSGPFDILLPAFALVETLVSAMGEEMGDAPRARIERYDDLWAGQRFAHGEPEPER